HRVEGSVLVPDEAAEIRRAVEAYLASPGVDLVVTTGGTGFSPRDRTVPALAPLFTAEVPGFGELFRQLSFGEIGAAAMLSRATAGVVGERLLFLLPGSPKAVELAVSRLILPEAGHLLGQVRRKPGG
ncbi:MAG TPA: MogA/MoaB family molybdenum cofactor biosynthesis protein, partial [Thermoanaerobaculia bacterium]|nr:MogA/MoaB family molybdenum cofactor biosynthesis protein [Thermoanaerobaculia bacterium]